MHMNITDHDEYAAAKKLKDLGYSQPNWDFEGKYLRSNVTNEKGSSRPEQDEFEQIMDCTAYLPTISEIIGELGDAFLSLERVKDPFNGDYLCSHSITGWLPCKGSDPYQAITRLYKLVKTGEFESD